MNAWKGDLWLCGELNQRFVKNPFCYIYYKTDKEYFRLVTIWKFSQIYPIVNLKWGSLPVLNLNLVKFSTTLRYCHYKMQHNNNKGCARFGIPASRWELLPTDQILIKIKMRGTLWFGPRQTMFERCKFSCTSIHLEAKYHKGIYFVEYRTDVRLRKNWHSRSCLHSLHVLHEKCSSLYGFHVHKVRYQPFQALFCVFYLHGIKQHI